MEILIISGLSGAGKSSAATYLEDMGYYTVDNVPADIILKFAVKNYEFVARLQKRMKERGAYQGKKYRDSEKRIIFAGDKFATE